MELQNKVDPWGRLHVNRLRTSTVMGNRGILHDESRRVVKRWTTKSWVACDPGYRGISRKPLFRAGSYSELFFLDEATALSAGHRPCARCQRERFNAFVSVWSIAFRMRDSRASIQEVDGQLHAERLASCGGRSNYVAALGTLPDGTFFEHGTLAALVYKGSLWQWAFDGYTQLMSVPLTKDVKVITPRSIVRVLAAGFRPAVHSSIAT